MINFLYSNIGRGHPYYLDGVVEILKRQERPKVNIHDVFEISKDPALLTWRMARWLYKIGSTDSIIGKWYNAIRDNTDHNQSSIAMRVMGADLRKIFLADETPMVVDHPVLVGVLKGKENLLYQHGEISSPKQALVSGADFVFVPLEETAKRFIESGYNRRQVVVTGLCVEPALVEQANRAFESRIKRYEGNHPLVGAFFSSGAEPKPHVEKLVNAAFSVAKAGGSAIVFAKRTGGLYKSFSRVPAFQAGSMELYSFDSRNELDRITAEHFDRFDYLMSPSHERTNWALGLGLPMFILEPAIGPFAPLNRENLLKSGVALSVDAGTATEFPKILHDLRTSGRLAEMAHKGWKRHSINGFQTVADFLINKYALNS